MRSILWQVERGGLVTKVRWEWLGEAVLREELKGNHPLIPSLVRRGKLDQSVVSFDLVLVAYRRFCSPLLLKEGSGVVGIAKAV